MGSLMRRLLVVEVQPTRVWRWILWRRRAGVLVMRSLRRLIPRPSCRHPLPRRGVLRCDYFWDVHTRIHTA